ncbi:MAG: ACP S-malonyltransferase [Phycisphaerales bacterium]
MAERVMLCPGQGAQAVGMGRAWSAASAAARSVFERADALLKNRLGAPLSELCYSGPVERLNQTDVSQPAIYVASVASWAGLLAGWDCGNQSGTVEAGVVAAAGLSLGEYTALHLAGAFSFEEGLELVVLRGRAMQDAAEAVASGMVALIGADEAQAQDVCDEARGSEVLVCANFNAPGQIVISGSRGACERAVGVAGAKGLRATALPVAGAFHSPIMAPAADRLRAALERTTVRAPRCEVYSNVTACPHAAGNGESIEANIRRRLVEQLTSPVRWAQSCTNLIAGVHGRGGTAGGVGIEYHELAPGKTLAGLMRRIDKQAKVETHDEPLQG